jgi:putative membrane protein
MNSNIAPILAALNACLNGLCAVFLVAGLVAIKKKRIDLHWRFMITAFIISVVFLISYLTRFYLSGVHRFPVEGPIKTFYLTLLGSHTILAAITPFLAIRTLYLAWKNRFTAHRKIARITWPIWMYVSITGVVVYLMLYHYH